MSLQKLRVLKRELGRGKRFTAKLGVMTVNLASPSDLDCWPDLEALHTIAESAREVVRPVVKKQHVLTTGWSGSAS